MSKAHPYRAVEVTCRAICATPKVYRAGLSLRDVEDTGLRCARCGLLVPMAGDAQHDVRTLSRGESRA